MNKKIVTTAIISIMAISFLASCGENDGASVEVIEINGVRWATQNVDTRGRFARNPSDAGGFFTWHEAQNACPRGWRLPTREELQSLQNAAGGEWTAVNGVNGHTFGTAPHQVFLPAAGLRLSGGALDDVGDCGYYWSSSVSNAGLGRWWLFNSDGSSMHTLNRTQGFSVRCVAE